MPRDWTDRPRAKPSPTAQYVIGGVAALVMLAVVIVGLGAVFSAKGINL